MAWELGLDDGSHDLVINNGAFVRTNRAPEVRQRVKVALFHFWKEYFLNVNKGMPYYKNDDLNSGYRDGILGITTGRDRLSLFIRRRIFSVPGVVQINKLVTTYDSATRSLSIISDILVDSEDTFDQIALDLSFNDINIIGK